MNDESPLSRRRFLAINCAAFAVGSANRQQIVPTITGVRGAERDAIAKLGAEFQQRFKLPGVSVAMSYRGKLKLLACFGYADRENKAAVQPKHMFRVASVSKPITSVAILKLVERKKLKLDERIFGRDGRLSSIALDIVNQSSQKDWLQSITIRHLLEHAGGGWTNQSGEAPMFAKPALAMNHADLIRWTVKNMPLKTKPGSSYAYSNFGYCVLGRVIERVTGKKYEQAVRDLVLDPCGARSTFVGGHTKARRRSEEVVYYDKYDPYGRNMNVTRMDAHGGWISTPTDLVRFAQRVDGFKTPPDILTPASITTMTKPSRGNYALGWNTNRSNNWWHTGSFNGGSSILARINDGHCWAVVVNTRSYDKGYFAALDQFPWTIKQSVKSWGGHDLFGNG